MDEHVCQNLFDAVRAQDRSAIDGAVEKLFPAIRVYVETTVYRGELQRLGQKVGSSPGDVCSHLGRKLITTPPHGTDGRSAVGSVMAWIKVVAKRHLIDLYKGHCKKTVLGDGHAHGAAGVPAAGGALGGPAPGPHALLGAAVQVQAWRALLAACYPAALPVFAALLDANGMTDTELAESQRLSVNNLHQLRSRMRKYLKAYEYVSEHPGASDSAIAAAMKAQLTPDTARIIACVRHFMTTNSWRKN